MPVRPATYDDIPALTLLTAEFFQTSNGLDLPIDRDSVEFLIQDHIEMDTCIILVSEVQGKIVGCIAGAVAPWRFNYDIKFLIESAWFVSKENQNKYPGEVRNLWNAFKRQGKQLGAEYVAMTSNNRPEKARLERFFTKNKLRHIDSTFCGGL